MQAVILAGGKGERLKPYTLCIPKPLIPIGDIPIIEVVIRQLKYYGFKDIILSVNYLSNLLRAFFEDGKRIGVNIKYSKEDRVLGTAGPLSIIDDLDDHFLVINGDLLTNINYRDLLKFHIKNGNDVTIATYKKEVKIDLGVIESNDNEFIDYIEKPTYSYDVSMGVYVLSKDVIKDLNFNERLDFPEMILNLKTLGKKISCYKGNYFWLDIGKFEDFDKAIEKFAEKREEFLPNE